MTACKAIGAVPIGPSLPCAHLECVPGRTLHFPIWWRYGSMVRDIVFKRVRDGAALEWMPVTPLDGHLPHPRNARMT